MPLGLLSLVDIRTSQHLFILQCRVFVKLVDGRFQNLTVALIIENEAEEEIGARYPVVLC